MAKKKKANPKRYLVDNYHDSFDRNNADTDTAWSEFGDTNVEGSHGTDNAISSSVAPIDARVSDLQRAAKLGRHTTISGANIAKMGDMRVPHVSDYGAGVDLVHKDEAYSGFNPQERFSQDVNRLEEFHNSLHGESQGEDGMCSMCRDN